MKDKRLRLKKKKKTQIERKHRQQKRDIRKIVLLDRNYVEI